MLKMNLSRPEAVEYTPWSYLKNGNGPKPEAEQPTITPEERAALYGDPDALNEHLLQKPAKTPHSSQPNRLQPTRRLAKSRYATPPRDKVRIRVLPIALIAGFVFLVSSIAIFARTGDVVNAFAVYVDQVRVGYIPFHADLTADVLQNNAVMRLSER